MDGGENTCTNGVEGDPADSHCEGRFLVQSGCAKCILLLSSRQLPAARFRSGRGCPARAREIWYDLDSLSATRRNPMNKNRTEVPVFACILYSVFYSQAGVGSGIVRSR